MISVKALESWLIHFEKEHHAFYTVEVCHHFCTQHFFVFYYKNPFCVTFFIWIAINFGSLLINSFISLSLVIACMESLPNILDTLAGSSGGFEDLEDFSKIPLLSPSGLKSLSRRFSAHFWGSFGGALHIAVRLFPSCHYIRGKLKEKYYEHVICWDSMPYWWESFLGLARTLGELFFCIEKMFEEKVTFNIQMSLPNCYCFYKIPGN